MDKQFAFLNFCTEYSSKGTCDKAMGKEFCFSKVFYAAQKQNNEYVIRIYKGFKEKYKHASNNICFMTKQELNNYISLLKKIHDFSFNIEEEEDRFNVNLKLNAPRVVHRFFLTWIRYSYEFPFNVYLREAYKLLNISGFKRNYIFNMFNLVATSSGYRFHGDAIHAIGDLQYTRRFYSAEDCKNILEAADDGSEINNLFGKIDVDVKQFNQVFPNAKELVQSEDFWNDEEMFKKRIEIYKHNKKLIRQWMEKNLNR